MKKILIASALALALPVLSMAATFSNVAFDNGDVTISGQGGDTKNATFRVVVPAGQVVEWVSVDVLGDNLAEVETSVGGDLGLQEGTHDVTLPVKLPPNTGTYTLQVRGAGIFGGIRAINSNDTVVGTASFSSALRVVADSSSSVGGTSAPSGIPAAVWAKFLAWINGSTPAPASNAKCDAIAPFKNAPAGTYSAQGVQLQSALLLDNPYAIPALKPGSSVPMGYRGPQTEAALSAYLAVNHCN